MHLWLLNGACCGDEEGAFTYVSALGDSTIDLAIKKNIIWTSVTN